jgi:HEAT repeat protein
MHGRCWLGIPTVLLAAATAWPAPAEPDPVALDEQVLRDARLPTSDAGLLDVFRQRTLTDADLRELNRLIGRLNDDEFTEREQASEDLVDWGSAAVPLLRRATQNPAVEIARRAERCLQRIRLEPQEALAVAARLLAVRRPAGAADVLLAYLPSSEDDQVTAEIASALRGLAFEKGQPNPALLRALRDKVPARRAVAAEALCQAGGRRMLPQVRGLLQDADPEVRLRVALLLADDRAAEAIPTLIALVSDARADLAGQADDYLRRMAGSRGPAIELGDTPAARTTCHNAWLTWWQTVDGPGLVERIRRATPSDSDRDRAMALVALLGDDDFPVRERSAEALIRLGPVAIPELQKAIRSPDVEVVRRAERCLQEIEQGPTPGVAAADVRLLALTKPPDAVRALLAYLPFAEAGIGTDEVQEALAALAFPLGGAPDPAAVRALHDGLPLRRSVAAVALCQAAAGRPLPAVPQLLHDGDPGVRLRVALILAEQKDREAVPVLIGLLGELAPEKLWQAEEVLRRLAGSQAPQASLGTTEISRRTCRDAWLAWWRKEGPKVDMARLDSGPRLLGYTVVSLWDNGGNGGSVVEFGLDGKPRWQITGVQLPIETQVLPGNRVLIAEYGSNRVTERNLKGDVLWEKQANNPINVQRLPNGHTFIGCYNQLMEVDRTGKEVVAVAVPQGLLAARRLRDGQFAVVGQGGTFTRMDRAGKVLKSFHIGQMTLGGFDVLPNGHILAPQYSFNKVVEYDTNGKQVWSASTPRMPTSASRLPNGRTLVACQDNFMKGVVVELDRNGKKVWEHATDGRTWFAHRR